MARLITDLRSTALRAKLFRAAARTPARHADSCGCVTGARFLAVTLVLSAACYTWLWAASGLSIRAALLYILVWSFLGALLGKTVGIVNYRLRHRDTRRMTGKPSRALKAWSRSDG
jgi:fatty acid desaturase